MQVRTVSLRSVVLHRRAKAAHAVLAVTHSGGRSGGASGSTEYGSGPRPTVASPIVAADEEEEDEEDDYEDDEYGSELGAGYGGLLGHGDSAGGEASPLMGGSGVSPLPSRRVLMKEHARQPHRHRKNKTKASVLVLVFFVFYPLLFFAAVVLPDSFSAISSGAGGAASVAAKDDGHGKGLAVAGFLRAHFDLVLFYAFLYVSALCGLVSQLSDPLRRFLLRRSKCVQAYAPACLPYSVSNLGVVLLLLLGALLGGETYYYIQVGPYKLNRIHDP
jgi:hypothetical protein